MDTSRKTSNILPESFSYFSKRINDNQGPENVLECEGGSYLDLQYKYNKSKK